MSFWPFGGNLDSSSINKLLDDPDLKLVDLMDNLEVLNELTNRQNPKLIDFLVKPENLDQLIDFVVDSVDFYQKINLNKASISATADASESSDDQNNELSILQDENDKAIRHITPLTERANVGGDRSPGSKAITSETDNTFKNLQKQSRNSVNEAVENSTYDNELLENDENKVSSEVGDIGDNSDNSDNSYNSDNDENNEDIDYTSESEENIFRRRSHTAAEILSSNTFAIFDAIINQTIHLQKVWSLLSKQLSQSYPAIQFIIKILERLLEAKQIDTLNFIRTQENLVEIFLTNIEIPLLMDLLIKIISTDKPDNPTGIIDILADQKLIPKLLNLLQPSYSQHIQSSTGEFLKNLISISANTLVSTNTEQTVGPNELTRELVSPKSIQKLIDIMLQKSQSGLSVIVGIIIELIRKNNSDYDGINWLFTTFESHPPSKRDPIYLGDMLLIFSNNLDNFYRILVEEEESNRTLLSSMGAIEPLGLKRIKASELIAELLHCSNMYLMNHKLAESIFSERNKWRINENNRILGAINDSLNVAENTDDSDNNDDDDDPFDISKGVENISINQSSPDTQTRKINQFPKLDDQDFDNGENKKEYELGSENELNVSGGDRETSLNISTTNPFVTEQREIEIKRNPVIGDTFKIKLIESKILERIIKMFLKFPWNNFFHNVVFDLIQQIFNGKFFSYNSFLIVELFEPSKIDITGLIMKGHKECIESENSNNLRLGYMGHLVLIAEEVVKFLSLYKPDLISPIIVETINNPEWISYVDDILIQTREMYNTVLGGISPDDSYVYSNPDAIILGDSANVIRESDEDEYLSNDNNNDNENKNNDRSIQELESSSSSSDSDNDVYDNEFNSNDLDNDNTDTNNNTTNNNHTDNFYNQNNNNKTNNNSKKYNNNDGRKTSKYGENANDELYGQQDGINEFADEDADSDDEDDEDDNIEEIGESLCRVPKHDDVELSPINEVH